MSHLKACLLPECAGDCVGGVDPAVGIDHILPEETKRFQCVHVQLMCTCTVECSFGFPIFAAVDVLLSSIWHNFN